MWILRRAAAVSAGLAVLPLLLFLAGTGIAALAGCSLHAGSVATACPILGVDVRGFAVMLLGFSIPALLLPPPALAVVVVWFIAEIVNAWRQ